MAVGGHASLLTMHDLRDKNKLGSCKHSFAKQVKLPERKPNSYAPGLPPAGDDSVEDVLRAEP